MTGSGAIEPGARWALAEGEVGGPQGTETLIAVANTSATPGPVRITLLFEDGTSAEKPFTLLAASRFTVNIAEKFPSARDRRFGTVVESLGDPAVLIVVERSMYSNPAGAGRTAGSIAPAVLLGAAVVSPDAPTLTAATTSTVPAPGTVPGALAVSGSNAGAALYNLKVVSDASPDLSELNSLIFSTTSR